METSLKISYTTGKAAAAVLNYNLTAKHKKDTK